MRIIVLSAAAALILASCVYFPAPPAPTPFPTLTRPAPTPAQPTSTPTLPPLVPTPTASDLIFRDDFNIAFASGWDWRGPDPAALSLSAVPGMLQVKVGTAYAFDEGLANLLLRPAPEGDFDLETHIVFIPQINYDFAGLIVYESRDAYLQAGRGMCRNDPGCVGDGIYMDEYTLARVQSGGLRLRHARGEQLFLRLQRRGQTYSLQASADGAVWWPVGSRQSSIKPAFVGLFAGQGRVGETLASFDYFEIRRPLP
jgi:regulation of enolase protein 1 (concanavalin A-like superfamily)